MTAYPPRLMDHQLPSNAFLYERSLASQVDHLLALNIPIEDLWNPWKCPADFLPYLAWAVSADLWDADWPISKKRAVVARSIDLHRLKGTEKGISDAIDIMGGTLKSVIAPPASLYLSITRTEEERVNFLARMPQLRIYPQRLAGPVYGFHVGQIIPAYTFKSEAFYRATPRVTLWRQGRETDLLTLERRREDPTISEAEELIQVREPLPFHGMTLASFGPWYPRKSTAKTQVYTVRTRKELTIPGSDLLAAEFAGPDLDPVDIRAETERVAAPMPGVYSGGALMGYGVAKYLLSSRARLQVYKRTYLYDPEVSTLAHNGRTFLGYNFRFGQPDYHAEIKVEVKQQRPPAAFAPLMYGYWTNPDTTKFRQVKQAVVSHQSLRDRILIDSHTQDVLTAGVHITAGGGFYAGQVVDI